MNPYLHNAKNTSSMFRNYFITAFRSFWRNKAFTAINVLGLSIGISAALVIFLIVYYEFSYDRFEKDGDRIYRVVLDAKFNGIETSPKPGAKFVNIPVSADARLSNGTLEGGARA